MDLAETFACSVARDPGATAIVDGALRLNYGDWYDRVRSVAGGLRAMKLHAGDHLVVVLSNRNETATLYWACQMLGVIFTPFNWRATGEEVAYVLEDAEAKAVVFEELSSEAVTQAIGEMGIDTLQLICLDDSPQGCRHFKELVAERPVDGPTGIDERATSLMLYTSGTTGRPKGVPRSQAAERASAVACVAHLRYRYLESQLGVMPLFHTMGIRALLMSMLVNGKFVCMASFDAEAAFRSIENEEIAALFLVPTMFHDMVSHPEFDRHDLNSVQNIAYAGMSMTTALTEQCAAKFKPEIFSNFYGSSEIYTFSVCDHVMQKPGCAGRAGFGQELRIVRADPDGGIGPGDTVQPGEPGEIIATMRSDEAFEGYWKRPDADTKAIRDGWYFTGDLGQIDGDGELYVIGRVDDMIISGGENIYPEEVEDVLDKSDLVQQAAVIGLPDERWGQKVVAFIEPASSEAGPETLDAVCLNSGLARFKRPRAYVFVEAIPQSASGKLLRRHLRTGTYVTLPDFESTL
ncbi:MAG: AMP-binding protein [Alphaproteobacteria bacterium]|nr:AMP-binding protein [Alphaproteobacteria bacterium]